MRRKSMRRFSSLLLLGILYAGCADAEVSVYFNLDGTLSMRGFAKSNQFPQLLQELDLAFSTLAKADQIHYSRFGGAIVDPITQRPFYVAAANESFFKSSKEYEKTQIENVFSKSQPGQLNLVMTDLFEQDLDIGAIKRSLDVAKFPSENGFAVWQWKMPFDGAIYDFDFRSNKGRAYQGNRCLYVLALGPKEAINQLNGSIAGRVTVGKANYLYISKELVVQSISWLSVTQTNNIVLLVRGGGGPPTYRVLPRCDTAELTMTVQLTPTSNGASFISFPGNYHASLCKVPNTQGRQGCPTELVAPRIWEQTEKTKGKALKVKLSCSAVSGAGKTLLRIERVGADNDVNLPDWVRQSSATNAEFNDPKNLANKSSWGEKTLNLVPFLREVSAKAARGTVMASSDFFVVAN